MGNELFNKIYYYFKWIIIILFVIYAVFPFLWLVLTSLKTNAELLDNPFSLPNKFQFKNYKERGEAFIKIIKKYSDV